MSDAINFKIKKRDLWKYSAFVLLAALVIFLIFSFTGNQSQSATINVPSNTGDFKFTENRALYAAIGPESSDVTVISFFDFQCPYCALAAGLSPAAAPYATQYSDIFGVDQKVKSLANQNKIKFVYAIHSFLGPESGYAAEATLCANEQDKYIEMHDAIFTAHNLGEQDGKYNKDNLKILAQSINGLSQNKFNECLDSSKYSTTVQQMASAASKAGVTGTPSYIINNKMYSASWTEISSVLNSLGVSTD